MTAPPLSAKVVWRACVCRVVGRTYGLNPCVDLENAAGDRLNDVPVKELEGMINA